MTLIYPNPIWISSVKRRKVDADFSGRADDHRHVGSPPSARRVRTKSTLVATY